MFNKIIKKNQNKEKILKRNQLLLRIQNEQKIFVQEIRDTGIHNWSLLPFSQDY